MSAYSESDSTYLFVSHPNDPHLPFELRQLLGMDPPSLFGMSYPWDKKSVTSPWYLEKEESSLSWASLLVEAGREGRTMLDEEQSEVKEESEPEHYFDPDPEPEPEPEHEQVITRKPYKGNNPFGSRGCESCEYCRRRKGRVYPLTPLR